jgi:hypothetical protein
MSREDGRCPSCGASLNPSSPICPSCGRDILQPHINNPSEGKIQPSRPPTIVLTRKNLIIGGVIVLFIAALPLITFLNLSRGGSNQPLATPIVKTVIVHDQPAQVPTAVQTPIPTSIPVTTPTSIPSGTILYQADWSKGLNGWVGGGEWKVLNGVLINDGTSNNNCGKPSIVPPFQPTVSNYAIEIKMQVIRRTGSGDSCFALNARSGYNNGQASGYIGNIGCCGDIEIYDASNYNQFIRTNFDPSGNWHTYRFEVKGTNLNLLIDGVTVAAASDAKYLGITGQVGLSDETMYVNVSSFVVYSLQ